MTKRAVEFDCSDGHTYRAVFESAVLWPEGCFEKQEKDALGNDRWVPALSFYPETKDSIARKLLWGLVRALADRPKKKS